MPSPKNEETETAILLRLIEANPQLMIPEVAEAILTVTIPQAESNKLAKLAAKARAGKLTAADEHTIMAYSRVSTLLGILKAKARLALKPKPKKKAAKVRVGS